MTAPYSLVAFKSVNNDSNHAGLFISPDGIHAYQYGQSNERLYEYTMATPWDVTSMTFTRQSAELYIHSNEATDLHITSDGLKLFLLGSDAKRVSEYSMSIAWNISTLAWVKDSTLTGTTPRGLTFSGDGTKMYTVDYNRNCYEYTLSTPWDIATKSLTYTLLMNVGAYYPFGLWISVDGKRIFCIGTAENLIIRYDLGTAFDLSTGVYIEEFSIDNIDYPPVSYPIYGIFYSPDESKMYLTATHDTLNGWYIFESDSVPISLSLFWTNFNCQTEIA
jgi:hypothetical protein